MATNPFSQQRIEFARFHKNSEKQLLPVFRKALRQTIDPVIQYAEAFGVGDILASAYDPNVWNNTYTNAFGLIGIKAARKQFYLQRSQSNKASAVDFILDIWSSIFRDYALNYSYNISRELNQTTVDIIRKALGDVYELGLDRDGSIRLFVKEIKRRFEARARVMTRTETTTIANLGQELGARGWLEQNGEQGYKIWLGRNDARERPSHLEENNTIITLDSKFSLEGNQCDRPGDIVLPANERINCRCSQAFINQSTYDAYVRRGRIVNGKLLGAS